MGPFPHNAPRAQVSPQNPAGTDGFEFVEFAHPEPQVLRDLFSSMGFAHVATHKTKAVEVWQQGDITYLINAEPASHAAEFIAQHGPCAPSMGWRVADANHAFEHAIAQGAAPYDAPGKVMDVPAIVGIGGSLIYFIDQYFDASYFVYLIIFTGQVKAKLVGKAGTAATFHAYAQPVLVRNALIFFDLV